LSAAGRDAGHGVEQIRIRLTQHEKSRHPSASCEPRTFNTSSKQIHKMPEGENKQDKQATQAQARQVIDVFHEISTLLVGNSVACRGIPAD